MLPEDHNTPMPGFLPRCLRCNARMSPSPDGSRLWCQFCGATRDDPDALQHLEAYQAAQGPSDYDPPSRDLDMTLDQRNALNDAWHSIQDGDMSGAVFVLRHLLDRYESLADAWYLLSKTTPDRGEQLLYLNNALAAQPYHEYAWHDKGVLEGVIPDGESDLPDVEPGGAVAAESETQECPRCGATVAFSAVLGALVCDHCGFRPAAPRLANYQGGYDDLDHALLQRRFGFSKEWHIGERVLVCQNCHAQLTLSGVLSAVCPFCDSAHVLVQDAVGSFEEPDALLPFKLDRRAAARAVHQHLSPYLRGSVERGTLTGVYLPFWAFEGVVMIMVPLTALATDLILPGAYQIADVLVGGVERPRQPVLYELMPYDLRALVPYDPRYLAQWPAQVYSIDVIQASITGRAYLKYAARQQASGYPVPEVELARSDFVDYSPPNTPLWRAARVDLERINYRLILLPVWMITLILRNGVRQPAIVNGQTGEAIISASFTQSETIIAGPNRAASTHDLPLPPRQNVIRPIAPLPDRADSVIRPIGPRPPRR